MIKHSFLLFFLFVLISCSQQKSKKNVELAEVNVEDNTSMKMAFSDQFIDGSPINHYLKDPGLPAVVKNYYDGNFVVQVNPSTDSLMNILVTPDDALTPFYFKCFMSICQKADSTLTTYLGEKCILLLENNTHYCINKLKKGSPDYFTGLVANEIYQQENWEDEINNLSLRLHLNLENDAPELRKELDLFIVGVKNDIEHMK